MNQSVNLSTRAVFTLITGSSHDDNTGVNQFSSGKAKRIFRIRINSICSETHINDADVISCTVT